jgi:hypothetical protein
MAIGTDVAVTEPTVIGAIVIRTEGLGGVDGAPASSGDEHHRRGRAGSLGTRIGSLLTRFAERFVDISRERFGLCGALAAGFVGLEGRLGSGARMVRPPDMEEETKQHQCDQEELVQQ